MQSLAPTETDKTPEEQLSDLFAPQGLYPGKHVIPLAHVHEEHQAQVWEMWKDWGSVEADGSRFIWSPQMSNYARLIWNQVQRLGNRVIFLVGTAGTGKTTVCLEVVKRWERERNECRQKPKTEASRIRSHSWLCAPTHKACVVLRDKAAGAQCCLSKAAIDTPHARFSLMDKFGGFENEPRWWPNPPTEGRTTNNALFIFDEVFAWSASLAYSLMCIPTGAWVLLVGDWRQLRPVDKTLFAQHLFDRLAYRIRVPDDDNGQDAVWCAMGRESGASDRLRAEIGAVPAGMIPAIELTKPRRVVDGSVALANAGPAIISGKFPEPGPGLDISFAESLDAAATQAIDLLCPKQDGEASAWKCVVPTNRLACRLTAEFNKRSRSKEPRKPTLYGADAATAEALDASLFFQRGDEVEILVNRHLRQVRNGDLVKYLRWGRPTADQRNCFHEVEPLDGRPPFRLYYTPGVYNHIMSTSLEHLAEDFEDDVGKVLAADQMLATRGLLCSPRIQTCHRSQGSTWDRVAIVIPLTPGSPWMCDSWLYVALTRAAKQATIIFAGRQGLEGADLETVKSAVIERLLTPLPVGPNPFRFPSS